ncbi:MauE/DoxX family redox-associated membrane protein [Flavobacterium sp. 120]|uniref:MauE/DoxX family redox-associated membrane protein n=1 Tax=Flavobacterium sp. 120 TaxID=2135626 RepID=UPI000EAEB82F|nr:MauE/DoxX family redox-associated membrane protein [Flavobacterium sp. 120]RKS14281.1 methylamine utilization protein MauE [Flavobacterium sp. 120]
MKYTENIKNGIVIFVSYSYAFLFIYAAISKIIDFENFRIQLGQSPLLSSFAALIVWTIPAIELLISVFLFFKNHRLKALLTAYSLMIMFTTYIYIILNYSSYIPCSCGGILEKMGWTEHLIFNLFFIIMAGISIILISKTKVMYATIAATTILSMCSIGLLYVISDDISRHHNSFIRQFFQSASLNNQTQLTYNSYYIAGEDNGTIYLGNTTNPLKIISMDSTLKINTIKRITLTDTSLPFRSVSVKINPPYFYVIDGTIPCIFRGNIADWKASLLLKSNTYFSHPQIVDSTTIAFRSETETGKSTVGILNFQNNVVNYGYNIMQQQIDGNFDSDGSLHYDKKTKQFIFLYRYRNQYTVANHMMKVKYRGNTIDTISKAQISIAEVKSRGEKKMSKPPLIVNKGSAVDNGLLFVNAGLIGRYEPESMWNDASIIDVYNLKKRSYISSFYIYDVDGSKLRSFIVRGNKLYGMIGSNIVSYKISDKIISQAK